ncbi:MAG: TorF family putative porin [Mariprofundaceae bacterium]
MRKQWITMLLMVFMVFAATTPAQAEDGISASGDIGAFNAYNWRGAPQTTDKVAVQGDVGLALPLGPGELSASVWASNTFASPAPQFAGRDAVEFDWTLDYSGSFGDSGLGYTLGGIYYTYLRDSTANFVEVYGGLSLDARISPFVTVYYTVADSSIAVNNLNESGDLWIDVGAGASFLGADWSATFSFAFYDADPTRTADILAGQFDDGASVITLGVSKDFEVNDLTITPSITAYIPIANKAPGDNKRYIYNTIAENDVVFGVNVAF